MIDFAAAPAALTRPVPLDPTKHVRYTLGMVLGVDDFDQEFAYLSARDRWLARDLSGYGTIWGLRLAVEVEASGPRVNVAPGTALTPCGQLVCVTPAQCASLNDWLAAHAEEARAVLDASSPPSSPPGQTLALHVVLCYRECPTDDVPIPGEPCRTEQTLTEPSRLKDDFRLELRTVAPQQPEEDSIRDFVAWLRQVPIVEGPGSTIDELLDAIRAAADAALDELGSPPQSPPEVPLDMLLGLPDPSLAIPAAAVGDYLRAAFRIWVTELRPALRHVLPGCDRDCTGVCGCGCCDGAAGQHGEPCGDDVVLLGTIELPVITTAEGALVAADSGWIVDEERRPYVLHTRFLQEWLLESAVVEQGSPPSAPPETAPIAAVTVAEGPLAANWNPATRQLDLVIPSGAGIDEVRAQVLAPGSSPSIVSFENGVLTLGLAAGAQGPPGPGITNVAIRPLRPGSRPTATLQDETLTLGIPGGEQGPPGDQFVVVAGRFFTDDGQTWNTEWQALRPIEVRPLDNIARGLFFVRFDGFERDARYMVKGTPIIRFELDRFLRGFTFNLVETNDELRRAFEQGGEDPGQLDAGLVVHVMRTDGELPPTAFELEISDYSRVVV